ASNRRSHLPPKGTAGYRVEGKTFIVRRSLRAGKFGSAGSPGLTPGWPTHSGTWRADHRRGTKGAGDLNRLAT
ncbi:MAG: hypothetical protein WA375_25120, partial [Pseudolabrys sp.]